MWLEVLIMLHLKFCVNVMAQKRISGVQEWSFIFFCVGCLHFGLVRYRSVTIFLSFTECKVVFKKKFPDILIEWYSHDFFFNILQKLSKIYLKRYCAVISTSHLIHGLWYLIVQKIWLGECLLETPKSGWLFMKLYVSYYSLVNPSILFVDITSKMYTDGMSSGNNKSTTTFSEK